MFIKIEFYFDFLYVLKITENLKKLFILVYKILILT